MDDDTTMDEPGNGNGVEIARPEPDAAAARREAATTAVAAMSRRSHSSSGRGVERATGCTRGRERWRLPNMGWSGCWHKRGGGASGAVLGWWATAKGRAEES